MKQKLATAASFLQRVEGTHRRLCPEPQEIQLATSMSPSPGDRGCHFKYIVSIFEHRVHVKLLKKID